MKAIPTKTSLLVIDEIINKGAISEGSVVADLGCGRSVLFLYSLAKKVGKAGRVYGIDILPEVIESAERDMKHHGLHEVSIIKGDLEKYNDVAIANNAIEIAFLINTINQISDTTSLFNEVSRILKKSGKLIIVDWHKSESPFGPMNSQRVSISQLKKALDVSKFSILDEFEAGPYHYGLVVSK